MGRKKSKATPLPPLEPQEPEDADFAAALLAEMGVEESQPESVAEPTSETKTAEPAQAGPKRNRRKEKLAQREAEAQKIIEEAEAEAKDEPNHRTTEIGQLQQKFAARGLVEVDIRPDGNCFFSSVSDQLSHRTDLVFTAQELREKAAQYILANRDDFVPFLLDSDDNKDIDEYTKELVSTPMWGGEMELLALANSLEMPIEVIQAGQSYTVGEQFGGEKLLLSYYTRIYGLGAHYNSVRDGSQDEAQDEA